MGKIADIVDRQDRVLGQGDLADKEPLGLITRNVIAFIQDSDGRYVICQRASHKDVDPDLYDASVCGNVHVAESYGAAAHRELREELDIECSLEQLCVFYHEFPGRQGARKHFTGVFYGRSDDPIRLNSELKRYVKLTYDELDALIRERPQEVCVGFAQEFHQVAKLLPKE